MSLICIREVVVACRDVAATTRFYADAFGFDVVERSARGVLLAAGGAPSGRLRLVPAAGGPAAGGPAAEGTDPQDAAAERAEVWDLGARLLGIYSRDLEDTYDAVAAAGGRPRRPVTYPYGAASLSEIVAGGPDDVWFTVPRAVTGAHRPSAAYAGNAERLHSELHTAVLVVEDHDAALAFFTAGGLETVFDGEMAGADFEELTGMPVGATLRLAFLGGSEHLPARFEIMSFSGAPTRDLSGSPLGIQRLVFACTDVATTRAALLAAGGEALVDGGVRGPVGVVLDLVESDR
ncbi:VOC family protein [Nocardioides gilvus]|uniref:VOC family protein n=1 Tax=Nocardioides gilvus TaxID=1735589 RepID=UPI000D74F86A|nr:VOC family protein [Nocardioides gilvus]